jgi:RecA/RadA recombinase
MLAICKKQNSVALLSGHYYGSPNSYGSTEEIGGGKHVRLAPHIIISLKKAKLTEGSGKNIKIIGNQIKAITLKNRFYPAFQECTINIDYRKGVDSYSGLQRLAMDAGYITQGGAWYTNTVTGEKVQGESKIGQLFDNDLLVKLDEYVQTTGYSSINKEMEETLKEADELIDEEFEDEDGSEIDTGNK